MLPTWPDPITLDLLFTLAAAAAVLVATAGAILMLPWTDDDLAELDAALHRFAAALGAALGPALPRLGGGHHLPFR